MQVEEALRGRVPDGLNAAEELVIKLAHIMTADRDLSDVDYEEAQSLGAERLAELTWLVGYYSALALSLAVFRPTLPEAFVTTYDKESSGHGRSSSTPAA